MTLADVLAEYVDKESIPLSVVEEMEQSEDGGYKPLRLFQIRQYRRVPVVRWTWQGQRMVHLIELPPAPPPASRKLCRLWVKGEDPPWVREGVSRTTWFTKYRPLLREGVCPRCGGSGQGMMPSQGEQHATR